MALIASVIALLPQLFLSLFPSDYQPVFHIVGGRNATIQEFPHQVLIKLEDDMCGGGSIVSRKTILTAAHLFDEMRQCGGAEAEFYSVRVGSSYRDDEEGQGKVFYVDRIILHPRYDQPTSDHDVALVRLAHSIDFDDPKYVAAPVKLATQGTLPRIGENLIVTGFGQISYDEPVFPKVLQAAVIPMREKSACCRQLDMCDEEVTKSMICAGGDNAGPIFGDSGGALITEKKELVGIVSWGYLNEGTKKHFAVFVNVPLPSVFDFIVRNLQEDEDQGSN